MVARQGHNLKVGGSSPSPAPFQLLKVKIMKLELLEEVPVCKFLSNEVADDYPSDKVGSINNLYKEVKAVRSRSHNCSMAAFRSRIAQVTYIYNTMVVRMNKQRNLKKNSIGFTNK